MNINMQLAKTAKEKGICDDWYQRLLNTEDTAQLADMYLKGIDFCIKNEFPDTDFIKAHFKDSSRYGIHVDDRDIKAENRRYVVALGSSSGNVAYTGYAAGETYAKHQSRLHVKVCDHAFAIINIYDDAEVEIHASDNAKVCVCRFGGHLLTIKEGNATIKILEKRKDGNS